MGGAEFTPDPADVDPARVLAALEVLGWPDDRGNDYAEDAAVMPAEAHYRLAEDVIRAADAADTRRLLPPDTDTRVEWGTRLAAQNGFDEEFSHSFEGAGSTEEERARRRAEVWGRRFGADLVDVMRRDVHTTPWVPVPTSPDSR